jgi:hypothetical protein
LLTGAAQAETVTARSTTIVSGARDPRDGTVHTVVPFLELVTLRATDVRNPVLDQTQIVVSGWGEAVLGDPRDGKSGLGDVDVAYVEGSRWNRHLSVRLGRQLVVPGTAMNLQLDGLSPTVRIGKGFGASGFVGVPVTPRFGYSRGEFATGGRAFWSHSYETEVGASILEILGSGRHILRRDAGVDGRYRVIDSLALSGLVRWSIPENRVAEASGAATWQPCDFFDMTGEYRRTAPDLFLPRYSLFTVFAQESRDEFGGYLTVRPWIRRLDLQADFHEVHDSSGWGWNTGGKATFRIGQGNSTRVGAESRWLKIPGGGYVMGRVFGWQTITPKARAVAELDAYHLGREVNGQTQSFFASGSVVYDLSRSWRAAVTGMANSTPYASHQLQGLVKVVYEGQIIKESTP